MAPCCKDVMAVMAVSATATGVSESKGSTSEFGNEDDGLARLKKKRGWLTSSIP